MPNIFFDIIIFLISLGVLVSIHEFGHFITAKMFGVYVSEFSIGFGPLIFKKKIGETTYSLRALPLGGFCAIAGEDMSQEGIEEPEEYKNLPPERRLTGISRWKRIIVMVAGVFLNFVLAFFLFIGYYGSTPQLDMKTTRVNIVQKQEGHYALEASGYQGENITRIEYEYILADEPSYKENVLSFDVSDGDSLTIALNGGYFTDVEGNSYYYYPTSEEDVKKVTFICEGGENYSFQVKAYVYEQVEGKETTYAWELMGAQRVTYRLNFFQTIGKALAEVGSSSILILKALGSLFTKEGMNNVGGPIAVFQVSSQASKLGLGYFVYLWGLISVNLGVFNLLPFPGLDGWHVLVITFEGITRKEMPKKAKMIMSTIGMLLLFGLMIIVSIKDIIGLF